MSSYSLDETQPNKPIRPPEPPRKPMHYEEPDDSGPGCVIWGMVGVFCLLLALGVVGLAGYSGWTEGLRIAQGNATATRRADVDIQCASLGEDVAANRVGLIQRRLESLLVLTPAPDCLLAAIPTATALYLQTLPTATPTPTATLPPTPTLPPAPTLAAATPAPTSSANTSGFDPAPLLAEAQQQVASGDNLAAIDTLEAIVAIDAAYEKGTVDRLLYQALTAEATRLYRTGGNLAEAILLTNRAEEYGDVGDLNYERAIAGLYLEAQAARNINFPLAIRLLNQIVYQYQAPTYRGASGQLYDQLVKYGDALGLTGALCDAQVQYDNALKLQNPADLLAKRDATALACQQGLLIVTVDPNIPTPTVNPLQPPTPTAPAVAPIGQPGA